MPTTTTTDPNVRRLITDATLVRVVCLNGGRPSEPCTFGEFVRSNPTDVREAMWALSHGRRYPVIAGALALEAVAS